MKTDCALTDFYCQCGKNAEFIQKTTLECLCTSECTTSDLASTFACPRLNFLSISQNHLLTTSRRGLLHLQPALHQDSRRSRRDLRHAPRHSRHRHLPLLRRPCCCRRFWLLCFFQQHRHRSSHRLHQRHFLLGPQVHELVC